MPKSKYSQDNNKSNNIKTPKKKGGTSKGSMGKTQKKGTKRTKKRRSFATKYGA